MPSNLNFIILILISGVPLLLWAMGLFGSVLPGEHARAMLHLVAHSLFKAHAFLSSGSGVDIFRAPAVRPAQSTPTF